MAKSLAVAGVTGAVGQEFLKVLADRNFPFSSIKMLASKRSLGKTVQFKGTTYTVAELTKDSFDGVDIALFSAGGSRSKEFASAAVAAGAVVVDNSSAFRMDPEVPLVVPEVNPQDVKQHKGIIANPNCSTIIMVVPIWPIHKVNPIKRIVVSTYQAASGAGAKAMQELLEQSRDVLDDKPVRKEAFPHQIAFNLFSHNSPIGPDGYCEEETKMVKETQKMFHCPELAVTATCVRVPVLRAHTEAINLELTNPMTAEEVSRILTDAPGVKIVDDRDGNYFPMPLDATGQDDVLVGRIRQDISRPDGRGIDMFVSGDQLRKGAALNAVQIAELLL
ncbi:MAG: aspartate-semialdehyde dehydrogenase [Actinobacteria bacterium]|nr:aspartate-semialdehyde dehydrogenase [Actinomycetota bacterium]